LENLIGLNADRFSGSTILNLMAVQHALPSLTRLHSGQVISSLRHFRPPSVLYSYFHKHQTYWPPLGDKLFPWWLVRLSQLWAELIFILLPGNFELMRIK